MKVYIANLAAYNDGEMGGHWFTLPVKMEEVFGKIFKPSELDDILHSMSVETQEKIINSHTRTESLQHCIRWGLQASEELKKKEYKIYDTQLGYFKEDLPSFDSEQEAYEYYGESLYEQCLEGNCGYEDYSKEEIIADLQDKTYKELFDMFNYSVRAL